MNEYSYEQEKKGLNRFVIIVIFTIAIITFLCIIFTNYKKEILICSKSEDLCYTEKTNLINMTRTKNIIKYSDIKEITYMPQRVKGNRFAKGYTSYILIFYNKKNNPVVIFSTPYFETEKPKNIILNFRKQMKNKSNFIKIINE